MIDLRQGTSHAGYSKDLSRYSGFDTKISNVTNSKGSNTRIIAFEGDGFIETWGNFSSVMVDGVKYTDTLANKTYYGKITGNDVILNEMMVSPSAPTFIDVSGALTTTVSHNGHYPVVQTIDAFGIQTEATVQHNNESSFTVTWNVPFTGKVIFAIT